MKTAAINKSVRPLIALLLAFTLVVTPIAQVFAQEAVVVEPEVVETPEVLETETEETTPEEEVEEVVEDVPEVPVEDPQSETDETPEIPEEEQEQESFSMKSFIYEDVVIDESQCLVYGQNLIENGSFEDQTFTGDDIDVEGWEIFPSATSGIVWFAEWIMDIVGAPETANIEIHNGDTGLWDAFHGDYYTELDSDWSGPGGNDGPTEAPSVRIAQTVPTLVGGEYALKFRFSPYPYTDATENILGVYVNGVEEASIDADGTLNNNTVWTFYEETFVATSTETEIAFADLGESNAVGTLLDGVVLCLIEEPKEPEPQMCSVTVVSDTTNTEDGAAAVLVSFIHEAWDAVIDGASWIWGDDPVVDPVNDTIQTFTKTFEWNGPVTASVLDIAADNSYSVKLNGTEIASSTAENNFGTSTSYTSFGGLVITGENTLSIEVKNWAQNGGTTQSNPAGLLYKMTVTGNTEVDCTDVPDGGGDGDGDGDGDGRFTLTINTTGYGQGKVEGGATESEEATSTILCLTDVGEGDDCSETYPAGTEVTLVVTPYEGSNFDNSWTVGAGTCTGNTTPCTVVMNNNIDLTAHFDLNDSNGGGGGGGSSRRSSSSSSDDDEPVPQVLGAQTEIMPIGAPNAGAGGTASNSTALSFVVLAMIVGAGFALRRFAN